jgi:hypothetical protein
VENPKELSPLAKGDIEIGKALAFPVYDRNGVLLLAQGQSVQSQHQLDELSAKGLYQNPRWVNRATTPRSQIGSVSPSAAPAKALQAKAMSPDSTGTGAVMNMNLPGQTETFSVRLVGAIGKQAFLTTHPLKDDTLVFVKEGQVWEFRSFDGLAVYHFTASVQKVLLSPQALLILSWPQETHWESRSIRSARRVACEIPAAAKTVGASPDGAVINGQIRDLSTGGVDFESLGNAAWPTGTMVELAFQLTVGGRKVLFDLHARVIKETDPDTARHSRYGLVFDTLDEHHFIALHAYVCEQMMRRLEFPLYTPR